MKKTVVFYETARGKVPFEKWLVKLKDRQGRALINARLVRLAMGHYGDCKVLAGNIHELRIAYGPGYRVYFSELTSGDIILLLAGGSKRTQEKDISKAKEYWQDFKKRYEDE